MKPLLENIHYPMLFGHRGYSAVAPENTLESFQMCVDRGIPGVELDVHLCKTGELVVVHDSNLKRVSGQDVVVENLTFGELRALDVGSHKDAKYRGAQIPLLSELFEQCGGKLYYDIELKCQSPKDTGLALQTWKTIKGFGMEKRCLISSFNPFTIRTFNTVSKGALPTAVIFADDDGVPWIFRHGWGRHIAKCTYLKPDFHQVDERMFTKFHGRRGYPIMVWTVNKAQDCERLLRLGVEGIISNNPGDFLALVGQDGAGFCS